MGFMNKISMVLAIGGASLVLSVASRVSLEDSLIADGLVQEAVAKHVDKAAPIEKKDFLFKFVDENLVDVINTVAQKKGINVILPLSNGANAINSKITIAIEDKMSCNDAWDFLIQILDIAGYSMVPRSGSYEIVKTTADVGREPLPIYIGVPWETIPETEERIRCVFYLSNIKVPADPGQEMENELYKVITGLMPSASGQQTGPADSRSRLAFDPVTNALIISERASVVRSIMQIVAMIDTTGFKEKIEMLQLFNTGALDVKEIFDKIMAPTPPSYRLDARKPVAEASYFSKFVRIIPYVRLNKLIILGREQAVDRVKDFIKKNIDISQDSGQSVFHVYALQYLDAAEFAPILSKIVANTITGGQTGQSRSEGTSAQGGIERMFEGVCVTHDRPAGEQSSGGGADAKAETAFYGGNRLIIAARQDDWVRIKKLCEELDTPQPQVIIEVLVADLTLNDSRLIGSMLRNSLTMPLMGDVQFQSAQLARGILVNNLDQNGAISPATVGLDNVNHNNDVDILKDAYNNSKPPEALTQETKAESNQSIAAVASPGTTAVSLIDPCTKKVWSLLEIQNVLDYRKVLTNPHIIAVNNKETKLVIGEMRLVGNAAVGNQGGNATIPRTKIDANLVLNIKPRICLSPDDNPENDTVQMGITVDINDFQNAAFSAPTPSNPQNANMFKRHVVTSAHIRNREVFPLGGLLRRDATNSGSETPWLGKIPIIGWFFKKKNGVETDTNLTVFLCPTVIRPRLRRGGVDRYTRDYVKLTKKYAQEGSLFDSLKDPVTRWFFNTESDVMDTVNDFLTNDEFKQEQEVRVMTKQSRRRAEERKERMAKELEYSEMKEAEQAVSAANEEKSIPIEQQKEVTLPTTEPIQAQSLASKTIQEACLKDRIDDSEERLKMLIQNEENPLKSYMPA